MYILQLVIAGLQQGGIIALLSMGLALMFGVLRLVNFAQADFMMLGMYGVIVLGAELHTNFVVSSILLALPAFIVGMLVYQLVIRQVAKAKLASAPEHAQLLATLGLSLVLQNGSEMIWGATPRALPSSRSLQVWHLGGLIIDQPRTIGFAIAVLLGVAMLWTLRHTHVGRAVRAAASDRDAASYVGINVRRAYIVTFGISILLSVIVGGILVTYYPVTPQTGNDFILLMFTAVIMGGLGNVMGAMAAGLILGLVQSLSQLVIPLQLNTAAVFGLFLLLMLVRPQGIFGEVTRL
ncbi:MAG: branched-chain amino acid ABC transporter permease [Rhodospirillales bacterium]|nr:branched-chain amino acid ABC transporter permease [Rhodospirillales bacterium]